MPRRYSGVAIASPPRISATTADERPLSAVSHAFVTSPLTAPLHSLPRFVERSDESVGSAGMRRSTHATIMTLCGTRPGPCDSLEQWWQGWAGLCVGKRFGQLEIRSTLHQMLKKVRGSVPEEYERIRAYGNPEAEVRSAHVGRLGRSFARELPS